MTVSRFILGIATIVIAVLILDKIKDKKRENKPCNCSQQNPL